MKWLHKIQSGVWEGRRVYLSGNEERGLTCYLTKEEAGGSMSPVQGEKIASLIKDDEERRIFIRALMEGGYNFSESRLRELLGDTEMCPSCLETISPPFLTMVGGQPLCPHCGGTVGFEPPKLQKILLTEEEASLLMGALTHLGDPPQELVAKLRPLMGSGGVCCVCKRPLEGAIETNRGICWECEERNNALGS